jgi:uncharacterized integral membrane protein
MLMIEDNERGDDVRRRDDAAGLRDDAYSRRKSNWVIWVAVIALVLVALYALVSGFIYAA